MHAFPPNFYPRRKERTRKEGKSTALHPILTDAARREIEGKSRDHRRLRHGSCLEDCWIVVRVDAFSAIVQLLISIS